MVETRNRKNEKGRVRRASGALLLAASLGVLWCCGAETSSRNHEVCLLVNAPLNEVEALLGEVPVRAELGHEWLLRGAMESGQGGLEVAYGDHRLGVYIVPDGAEGHLRVWCWSDRHAVDAIAVRAVLERVLGEQSISFVLPGEDC